MDSVCTVIHDKVRYLVDEHQIVSAEGIKKGRTYIVINVGKDLDEEILVLEEPFFPSANRNPSFMAVKILYLKGRLKGRLCFITLSAFSVVPYPSGYWENKVCLVRKDNSEKTEDEINQTLAEIKI